jgi:hypothetical protein
LDAGLDDAVTNARRAHVSWQQIAAELGMPRQAAWERWQRLDPWRRVDRSPSQDAPLTARSTSSNEPSGW